MMTSDRIDHAAEARRCLAEVDDPDGHQNNLPVDWCGISGNEQWMVSASFAEAQVHATLALVEQQRVANILKVDEMSLRADYEPGDEIREALGIRE